MALSDIQGTTVAQTVLGSLYESSVAQALIGSEIDGTQAVGRNKTVRVAKTEAISAVEYTGSDLDFGDIAPAYVDLTLDQAWASAAALDDVDEATLSVDVLGPVAVEMGRGMAAKIDQVVIDALVDDATALSGDHTVGEGHSAYELLVELGVALDEANAPEIGRWVIVPSAFAGQLALDSRLNRASAAGDSVAMTGRVGEAAGFAVVKSNRIAGDTVLAGHGSAAAFAQAVSKVETGRSEKAFKTLMKALAVFGVKVLRTECLVKATWTSGS